jgi:predicted ATPase
MRKVHRIALTGAQGTGKSTLARHIAQALGGQADVDVRLYTGLGDFALANRLATGMVADASTVRALARWHLEREAGACAAANAPTSPPVARTVVILDRCLLDTLAYAEVLACLPAAELHELRQAAGRSSRMFEQLLFIRITSDYPVTSVLDETPEFRRAVEQAIEAAGTSLGLAMTEVRLSPPMQPERVCREVLERLT